MKENYFKLIQLINPSIPDPFEGIIEWKYSDRIKFLKELLSNYRIETIQKALTTFYIEKVRENRVEFHKIKQTIKYYCNKLKR